MSAMIKKEHIKQAIDEISKRDVHIGYALDRMLGMGVIGVPEEPSASGEENNLYFIFDGEKVRVNRVLYFNEGPVPIEQGLLKKYGEICKRQELQERESPFSYRAAFGEIRAAGLKLLVTHEIDYAIKRLEASTRRTIGRRRYPRIESPEDFTSPETISNQGNAVDHPERLIAFLGNLKRKTLKVNFALPGNDLDIIYQGSIGKRTPAYFVPLPISMESLMQVADIDLEFFHARFILDCLICGLHKNLFACVVGERIVGLSYVIYRYHLFGKDLEIRFLSSIGDRKGTQPLSYLPALKGVGTFLIAGLWMFSKNELRDINKIFLDAEVESRRFYGSLGFEPVGLTGFLLKEPNEYLMKSILILTHRCRSLRHDVIREVERILKRQIESQLKKKKRKQDEPGMESLLPTLMECFRPEARPEFGLAAVEGLLNYGKQLPESQDLIEFALKNASEKIKAYIQHAVGTSC